MASQKVKRVRGLILSRQGWQKVQDAKTEWEFAEKRGNKVTLEEISDRSGLTTPTISKILTMEEGVDKRSIATLFSALNLELTEEDCTKPHLKKKLSSVPGRIDWGEAVDVSVFLGRERELATLEQWIVEDRCRLISLVGIGGVGKTSLSIKIVQQLEPTFNYIIWRSLRDIPPVQELLVNLVQFLSDRPIVGQDIPESISEKINLLIECLRLSRCLVVLDNLESLMCAESRAGICSEEYQEYSLLFQRLAESDYQSCVLLTTREKPKETIPFEGNTLPVRSMQLVGFKEPEGEAILQQKGLEGTTAELAKLVKRYNGNPLALKIVGTTILDLFIGDVAAFLSQDMTIFGDIRDVLTQQFQRLTDIENKIMYWLAINREPIILEQLQTDLVDSVTQLKLLEGLESLSRRCLIDKAEYSADEDGIRFTLQSVVLEYATSQLVEKISQEIVTQEIELLRRYALIKATAKDYIKEAQKRLILQPLIESLFDVLGSQSNIEERLNQIKTTLQATSPRQTGYVAGNILNLLNYLGTDLTGADFSNLCIWQADLQNVRLHDVSFQNADLSKTIFSETFSGIISVAFSNDGKILAAGDSNGEIRLWRAADNQPINILRGHTSWVTSLSFSPNDTLLASGSSDSDVKLWNAKTGECLKTLTEHQGEVWSVVFSPNGRTLVSGSDDCTIRVWLPTSGECIRVIQEHTSWVTSLAFNSDGSILASGSDDCTIKLWNFETNECLKVFRGHSDGVRSIAFNSDDSMLVSGSDDHTLKIWEINTGECIKTLDGHENQIFSIAISPNGNFIASGCNDRTVKLWDASTGQCFKTYEDHSNWVFSVAFSPDGNTLISGSQDQTVKLWDLNKSQCIKTFKGYSNPVLSVCLSPNNKSIASGSRDQMIRFWDIETGLCYKILEGHLNWVYSVDFDPKGDLLISGSEDKTIKIWDINTNKCLKTINAHEAAIKSVCFSPNGKIFASASEDCTVKIWDTNTGQIIKTLRQHEGTVWSIAFNPDGKTLASGSLDRTIKLWNVETGKCFKTLSEHETWVWSVSFSPDGNILASSSTGGVLKFWDVNSGECIKNLNPTTGWLLATAFSKNGQMFAASSQDCTIKLWNAETYESIKTFSGHESGYIWSISFCSDTEIIVSSSEDETVKIWDIKTGNCLRTLKGEGLYKELNLKDAVGLSDPTALGLRMLGTTD